MLLKYLSLKARQLPGLVQRGSLAVFDPVETSESDPVECGSRVCVFRYRGGVC